MKCNRVTDFRIDRVEMTAEGFGLLFEWQRELIRAYAEFKPAPRGLVIFEIPIYRWDEVFPAD